MVSASAEKETASETSVSTREAALDVKIVVEFVFVEAIYVQRVHDL